jgi:hypothetical protein
VQTGVLAVEEDPISVRAYVCQRRVGRSDDLSRGAIVQIVPVGPIQFSLTTPPFETARWLRRRGHSLEMEEDGSHPSAGALIPNAGISRLITGDASGDVGVTPLIWAAWTDLAEILALAHLGIALPPERRPRGVGRWRFRVRVVDEGMILRRRIASGLE